MFYFEKSFKKIFHKLKICISLKHQVNTYLKRFHVSYQSRENKGEKKNTFASFSKIARFFFSSSPKIFVFVLKNDFESLHTHTYVKRLRSLSDSEYWEQESVHTCTRAEGADGLGFWVRKGGKRVNIQIRWLVSDFQLPRFFGKRKNSTCPLFLYYLANSSCCYCMPNRLAFTKHKDELERHAIYDNPRVLLNLSKKELHNFCPNLLNWLNQKEINTSYHTN